MVLAAQQVVLTHRDAATTAASMHLRRESTVVETAMSGFTGATFISGVAVLAPQQGVVEWYPDMDQPLTPLAPLARDASTRGWRVAVVVPAVRMGEAHRALRGSSAVVQPWWIDGERVRFGGPEVP